MPIDRAARSALHRMASGVFVVAASHDGHTRGFTATWVFQASFRHPLVAISVDKTHATYPLIVESQSFTVNVLSASQAGVARYFGTADKDEQQDAQYFEERDGKSAPEVRGAVAVLDCRIVSTMDARDHSLILGEVEAAALLSDELPLVYWPAGGFHTPATGRL